MLLCVCIALGSSNDTEVVFEHCKPGRLSLELCVERRTDLKFRYFSKLPLALASHCVCAQSQDQPGVCEQLGPVISLSQDMLISTMTATSAHGAIGCSCWPLQGSLLLLKTPMRGISYSLKSRAAGLWSLPCPPRARAEVGLGTHPGKDATDSHCCDLTQSWTDFLA